MEVQNGVAKKRKFIILTECQPSSKLDYKWTLRDYNAHFK